MQARSVLICGSFFDRYYKCYALGYYSAAERRGPGFLVQAITTAVLLFGALGRIVYGLATGSA